MEQSWSTLTSAQQKKYIGLVLRYAKYDVVSSSQPPKEVIVYLTEDTCILYQGAKNDPIVVDALALDEQKGPRMEVALDGVWMSLGSKDQQWSMVDCETAKWLENRLAFQPKLALENQFKNKVSVQASTALNSWTLSFRGEERQLFRLTPWDAEQKLVEQYQKSITNDIAIVIASYN